MFRPRFRAPHYSRRPYYQQRHGMALLLLAGQLLQVGLDRVPPVTLATIVGQVIVFLRLLPLKKGWPSITDVCISSDAVLGRGDVRRLALASFFHLDDWHLYYNMVSFLWKGMRLEQRMGSAYFAYLIGVFTIVTNVLTVALGVVASEWSGDPYYYTQCAAGFSGVIFALKVLTTHYWSQPEMVMGFLPVPGPFVSWVELLLIQIIAPNSSFLGHLAGILVGLLYIKGPLKEVMDKLAALASPDAATRNSGSSFSSRPSYTYQSGTAGGSSSEDNYWRDNGADSGRGRGPEGRRETGADSGRGSGADTLGGSGAEANRPTAGTDYKTYAYTGGLSETEQLQRAMAESLSQARPMPAPSAPPYEPRAEPPSYAEATGRHGRLYPDIGASSSTYHPGSSGAASSTPGAAESEELRRRRLARFT